MQQFVHELITMTETMTESHRGTVMTNYFYFSISQVSSLQPDSSFCQITKSLSKKKHTHNELTWWPPQTQCEGERR